MGVFNLSQNNEEQLDSKMTSVSSDTTSIVADAIGGDSEKSNVKISNTDSTIDDTGGNKIDNKEQETITLAGPLSHIYTQALNLAYANEGTSTMVSILETRHGGLVNDETEQERMDAGNAVTADGTYVYCVDSSDLNSQGLVAGTEAIRSAVASKKYKAVVLAIESSSVVTSKTQLLGEMGSALGAKVCLTRNNAVHTVIAGLRK